VVPLRRLVSTDLETTGTASRSVAPLVLALTVALGAFALGYGQLERIETGTEAEHTTLAEARAMAAGDQRFGIVEYTHFPNGPLYIAATLTRAGLSERSMRLVPLGLAAAAFGFMAFALLAWAPGVVSRAWIVTASAVLLLQPAAILWMGALHEHSYAFAMVLTLVAISIRVGPSTSWALFPFGFLAGWIGYDWLPAQAMTVLAIRWLVLARDEETPLLHAAAGAALDAMKFASGVALAVLAHLVQLGFYFDSFEAASRDLLGSAAARANTGGASQINPEYGRFIAADTARLEHAYSQRADLAPIFGEGFDFEDPPRLRLSWLLYRQFGLPRWSHACLLALAAALGVALSGLRLFRERARRGALVGAVALLFAVAAPMVWVFLMPQHALSHMHMLPRHGLVPFAVAFAIPVLIVAREGGIPLRREFDARAFAQTAALYALCPGLLVATVLHALIALG